MFSWLGGSPSELRVKVYFDKKWLKKRVEGGVERQNGTLKKEGDGGLFIGTGV